MKYNIRYNEVGGVNMKDILQEITRLRLQRKWTEYELAKHSNIPQSTISTWYSKKQIPTIITLDKICKGMGISLSQFFAENNDSICLTSKQRDLLDNWSVLNSKQQEIILELLKNIKS